MPAREIFSSRTATILTMVGVSIGLGNLWRFPYMMGKYGGSGFLFVYLLFIVLFGIPAVMAEWGLGRSTRAGPLGAFAAAFGQRFGLLIGGLLTISVLIANSYYLVVVSQVFFSAWFSAVHGFQSDNLERYSNAGLANGPLMAGVSLTLLAAALAVVRFGVQKGIERVSKLFVPFFGVVVIYLILHVWMIDGAKEKFYEFLYPDFRAMQPMDVFAAMGQAIFSLSLGGTFFVIYGSYLKPEESITASAGLTALGDTGAALLAALFVVPAVLVFGLDLASGPNLVFVTLPQLFIDMPLGRIVGSFFLVAFGLMAFLSSVAALQVGAGALQDRFGMQRRWVILALAAIEAPLVVVTAFRQEWIGTMDLIFGSGMQCLGCLLACLALVWGLGAGEAQRQLFPHGIGRSLAKRMLMFWLKWVVPGGILIVLLMASGPGQALLRALGLLDQ